MDKAIEQAVRRRARDLCGYCHLPQNATRETFHIDHVVARQHGGLTILENLALCCLHCNLHKGPNLAGIDPITSQTVLFINPRQDSWEDHFEWNGPELLGKTSIARATIRVLSVNRPLSVRIRASLMSEGLFPLAF